MFGHEILTYTFLDPGMLQNTSYQAGSRDNEKKKRKSGSVERHLAVHFGTDGSDTNLNYPLLSQDLSRRLPR